MDVNRMVKAGRILGRVLPCVHVAEQATPSFIRFGCWLKMARIRDSDRGFPCLRRTFKPRPWFSRVLLARARAHANDHLRRASMRINCNEVTKDSPITCRDRPQACELSIRWLQSF